VNGRSLATGGDTGMLTATLRAGCALEARYRRHLTGRRFVIATQVGSARVRNDPAGDRADRAPRGINSI
jgi:hypothetical protein